jgi:hypothetical protein
MWLKQDTVESPEDMAKMLSNALNIDLLEPSKSLSNEDNLA